MNKLAQYLNQHLIGEVTTDPSILRQYSSDASPLAYAPQMVVYARSISDVRKLLRFTWQLAEKGHQLPLTVRGGGSGTGGGAIGSGIVVSLREYIRTVFEYDPKQHLLRLQPGATVSNVQTALGLYGDTVPALYSVPSEATIGGWLSEEVASQASVKELEVVLANGDLLHAHKLSKREFHKKKGEQTFEGDIYRGIDTLLEDHAVAIDKIVAEEATGYSGLAMVKGKDGSFDLTPLFIGSQGTLGVISEVIIESQLASESQMVVLAAFDSFSEARDTLDEIEKIGPTDVQFIGRSVIERALEAGKQHPIISSSTAALVVMTLRDGSVRSQEKRIKRLTKACEQHGAQVVSGDRDSSDVTPVEAMVDAASRANEGKGRSVTLASDAFVPIVRCEEFATALDDLAKKRSTPLLLTGKPLEGKWTITTQLNLDTVGGKQLVFKLIEDCTKLITDLDGSVIGNVSEGRMSSASAYSRLDPEVVTVYAELKKIFDPNNVLNTGVKQPTAIKDLAKHLSSN